MDTNDTSAHLRVFPDRNIWRDTSKRNYKRYRLPSYGTKGIIITLWDLTKKYEIALKHQEVVPIKESEIDREEVTDAFRFIETPWERNLDGRFYHTLALMAHRRDSQLATPEITSEEWIHHFANEVKRRATPLLFLIRPERSIPPFDLPPVDTPVALAEPPSRDDQLAMQKHKVPFEEVSFTSLDNRRNSLVTRLQGKRFKYSELADHLSNWELDLLSQMIRDNSLPAIFDKRTISFREMSSSKSNPAFSAVAIAAKNYEEVRSR
jgi:hypothetical protein